MAKSKFSLHLICQCVQIEKDWTKGTCRKMNRLQTYSIFVEKEKNTQRIRPFGGFKCE